MLIIIIISQGLGQVSFKKKENEDSFSMDEVKSHQPHMNYPTTRIRNSSSFRAHHKKILPKIHQSLWVQTPQMSNLHIRWKIQSNVIFWTSSGDYNWLHQIPNRLPGWGNTEAGHLVLMEEGGGGQGKVKRIHFNCPPWQLNRWTCHSVTHSSTLLKNTTKEHSERLVTLETCNQSDEETWPDQQKDKDKYIYI